MICEKFVFSPSENHMTPNFGLMTIGAQGNLSKNLFLSGRESGVNLKFLL